MSGNIKIFENTYEKVLSIINKVKDFIKKNTQDYQSIIDELEWVIKVITNKTLYSYEVKKNLENPEHQKFLEFINRYNEEFLNLDKKHVLVRDLLNIGKNKGILLKPSLILKKLSTDELNLEKFNKVITEGTSTKHIGNLVMNLYFKKKDEKAENNSNKKYQKKYSGVKSSSNYKNNHPMPHVNKVNSKNENNNIKTPTKPKNETGNAFDTKNKNLSLSYVKQAMEKYYKSKLQQGPKGTKITTIIKDIITKRDKLKNDPLDKKLKNTTSMSSTDIFSTPKKEAKHSNPENINLLIEKNFEFMKSITDKDFNIFNLKKLVGYDNVLPIMCHFIIRILGLYDPKIISIKRLIYFLTSVSNGYLESTLYHNSMHGADVCHSLFLYIINSNLEEICETSVLDILGLVISSMGHDLGHPGVNNNYLINSESDLALTYNDISCLENYHTSTLFKILRKEENNILENLDENNFKLIRKRMVSQILATDMANHANVVSGVKAKILAWELDNINNDKKFIFLTGNEKTKFNEQQTLLNYLIHAADLGHNTKKFEISIQWVKILSEEFWLQGDSEKEKNLSISFLCDRSNINIPPSQVGFLQGFILTTFDILVKIFPSLGYTMENAKNNVKEWQSLTDKKRKRGWTPEKKEKDDNEENKRKSE